MPKIIPQSAELLSATPEAEKLIELAGRTCYASEDKITEASAAKFVKMICSRKHVSVIEHAYATIKFTTCRGITHEAVRHRISSFSQSSTRFIDSTKKGGMEVIEPLGMNEVQHALWWKSMCDSEEAYFALRAAGAPPEVARDVLPNSFATRIVWSANLRSWSHVMALRYHGEAGKPHPLIKQLMSMALPLLLGVAPTVFAPKESEGIERG